MHNPFNRFQSSSSIVHGGMTASHPGSALIALWVERFNQKAVLLLQEHFYTFHTAHAYLSVFIKQHGSTCSKRVFMLRLGLVWSSMLADKSLWVIDGVLFMSSPTPPISTSPCPFLVHARDSCECCKAETGLKKTDIIHRWHVYNIDLSDILCTLRPGNHQSSKDSSRSNCWGMIEQAWAEWIFSIPCPS